jgi:predicted O-methyltransferase YrrM
MELPWSKTYFLALRAKSLVKIMEEPQHSFSPKFDDFIRNNWHHIHNCTLVDPFRIGRLLDCLHEVKNIDGDILEFGSYKGGTGILMGLFLKANNIQKHIHLFDSFAGLPEPDKDFDKGYKEGMFVSDYDLLSDKIHALGLQDIITLHKGWFKDTLPGFLKNHPQLKAAMLHVDCDLYTSTMDCFPDAFPILSDNGVVVLDDFNDGGKGEKKAIVENLNEATVIQMGPAPQAYFYKKQASQIRLSAFSEKEGHMIYDFEDILSNTSYLNWLHETTKIDLKSTLVNYFKK